MSLDDFNPGDPRDNVDGQSETPEKSKWVMTRQAWDKLMNAFSSDQEEAGRQYERVRIKLFRTIEWQAVGPADEIADEIFNRVARRIDEGQRVDNLIAYIVGIARNVCHEYRKKERPFSLDDNPDAHQQKAPDPIEPDVRLSCFDKCLAALSADKRELILEYYTDEGRDKIRRREKLAERLGIHLNALRIRAHRIRMTLESCIAKCLGGNSGRNE